MQERVLSLCATLPSNKLTSSALSKESRLELSEALLARAYCRSPGPLPHTDSL